MAEDIFWVNTNMDAETKAKLEKMAAVEDRSLAWMIRSFINQEWDRRLPVSVETPVDMAKPVAEPE